MVQKRTRGWGHPRGSDTDSRGPGGKAEVTGCGVERNREMESQGENHHGGQEVPAGRREGEVRAKWSWDQKLESRAG